MHTSPDFQTQVCLVSEQALPNLTPALADAWRPRQVVLVVSDDQMGHRADWLATLINRHGIATHIRRLSSALDFDRMQEDFRRIVADFPDAALNATGGKKTMSLAAFGAFREAGLPVFYVERDNNVYWLMPTYAPGASLSADLSLEELLFAHGQTVIETQADMPNQASMEFANKLFTQSRRWAKPLVSLMLHGDGEDKLITSKYGPLDVEQKKLLAEAADHGLVRRAGKDWLCGKAEASFLTGRWLEAYICSVVQGMKGTRDVCNGLKIQATQAPTVKNEIDVAFVKDNRLHIIECKALKPASHAKSVADFLYTLESVRKNGGLAAKAALLTWGAEPGPGDRARADDNRIRVFAGSTLNQLELALQAWISAS